MRSTLPVLLLVLAFVSVLSADARKSYQDAKRELERAYFDDMEPDERERLFEAYGICCRISGSTPPIMTCHCPPPNP